MVTLPLLLRIAAVYALVAIFCALAFVAGAAIYAYPAMAIGFLVGAALGGLLAARWSLWRSLTREIKALFRSALVGHAPHFGN